MFILNFYLCIKKKKNLDVLVLKQAEQLPTEKSQITFYQQLK